ncbi:MAG: adenosylcobinamide-GDP ribazoletransferase [Methanomicrobiales archaeon]|nr:adenosylcobinamide-GDP ribazoletransferase [Methanomicrobiales archaeon]
MYWESLRALLKFTTRIPVGGPADFDAFATRSYLYPLAGWVIGGIAALLVLPLGAGILPAAIALAAVLFLSGFHHLDGLLDFGDAAMVQGDRERRIAVLSDHAVGAGGFGLGVVVTLLSFAALAEAPSVAVAIVAGEVSAKLALSWITVMGKPFREGIHSQLFAKAQPWFLAASLVLFLPVMILTGWGAVVALLVMLSTLFLFMEASRRLFGGVNGDVAGAIHEVTRALVMVALALLGNVPF